MTSSSRWLYAKERAQATASWRQTQCISYQADSSMQCKVNGKPCINFCSNDYLGISQSTDAKKAFQEGLDRYGTGSGASPLVSGYSDAHKKLEVRLAEFLNRDRVLLFSSGYAANVGSMNALINKVDHVIMDKLCHASLYDGVALSNAKTWRYAHADFHALESRLNQVDSKIGDQREREAWLISESVFSMDGDLVDLKSLANIAQKYQTNVIVDDAHGLGWLGKRGAGAVTHYDLDQIQVPVLNGTFGKAFGCAGAFVAGSDTLVEYLVNKNRAYIYSTAMPAAQAVGVLKAVELVEHDEWRREKLRENIKCFKTVGAEVGLDLQSKAIGPIQPILIGSNIKTCEVSKCLLEKGFYVSAIRPPTVPQGQARLRVTLTSLHKKADIKLLIYTLSEILAQ